MKLLYSPTSPFARKCLVAADELGLRERIELTAASPHPINRDAAVFACNPLGKIPVLVLEDGSTLYDSRVICEYLNDLGGGRLLPREAPARHAVLVEQALADGILDAAVLVRYESTVRPPALQWADWIAGQTAKIMSGVADLERRSSEFGARVDLGTIASGCALGYLDFRFAASGWRARHPRLAAWFDRFAERDSMRASAPPSA